MVQNQALRDTWWAWTGAAVGLLKTKPIPLIEDMLVILQPESRGYTQSAQGFRPDFQLLVRRATDELAALPEAHVVWLACQAHQPVMEALASGSEDGLGAESTCRTHFTAWLGNFLGIYLDMTNAVRKDIGIFASIYALLEQYIFAPEAITLISSVQFINLEMTAAPVRLSPNAVLRPTSNEEQIAAIRRTGWDEFGELPNVILEVENPFDKTESKMQRAITQKEAAEKARDRLLLCLRLLRGNRVRWYRHSFSATNPFVAFFTTEVSMPKAWFSPRDEPYVINDTLAEDIDQLWGSIHHPTSDARLELALARFDESYERISLQDRLIDYWIALEGLYSNSPIDLKYRVPLLIARDIGSGLTDRIEIFSALQSSYDARSLIVHGKAKSGKQLTVIETGEARTGDILRDTLRQCLVRGRSPDLNDLHEKLLS